MAYKLVTILQSRRDIETLEEAEKILETIWQNNTGLWDNVLAVSIVDSEDGTPIVERERDNETRVIT